MAVQTTQLWQQQLHQLMQVHQQLQHQQSLLHQSSSGSGHQHHHHQLMSCQHQQQFIPTPPQGGHNNNYPNYVNAANALAPAQPPPAPDCSPVCDVIPLAATTASWAMTHPIVCSYANNPHNNCFQPMPSVQPPPPSSLYSACYPVSEPFSSVGLAPQSVSPVMSTGTAAHGGTYATAAHNINLQRQQQQQSVPSHLPAAITAYCSSTSLPQHFPHQRVNAFDVAAGGVAAMPHVSSQPASPAPIFHQGAHQPQQHQGRAEFLHHQQRRADSSQHSSDTSSTQVASRRLDEESSALLCQNTMTNTQPAGVLQPVNKEDERTVVADPASAVSFTTSPSASPDDGLLPSTSVSAEAELGRRLPSTRPVSPNSSEYYSSPGQKSSNEHASNNVLVAEQGTPRPGVESSAVAVVCSDFSNDEWQVVKTSPTSSSSSSSSEKWKHASCGSGSSKGAIKAGVVTFSVPCLSSADAVHHVVEESSSAVSHCRDVQRHQCCSFPVSDDDLSDDEDEPAPLPATRLSDLPKPAKGARRPPRKNDTFCGTAVDDVLNSSWKREAEMQQTARMPDYLARRATSAD